MWFIDRIFSLVWDITFFFEDLYYNSGDIPIVGQILANIFWAIMEAFWGLLTPIAQFGDWVNDTSSKVANILSWATIWSYILSYVPNLLAIRDWFSDRWNWFQQNVSTWWETKKTDVQGWISTAVQPFNSMLTAWTGFWGSTWPAWVTSFNSLKSAWDNFWSYTFPNLVSFTWLTTWWAARLLDVQGLIDSALKTWFPFYDDLVKLWGDIALFFTDPLEYLWERFSYWFFGQE